MTSDIKRAPGQKVFQLFGHQIGFDAFLSVPQKGHTTIDILSIDVYMPVW